MNILIIYDNDGEIFSMVTGSYVTPNGGIQYIETNENAIPEKNYISGIDVTDPENPTIIYGKIEDTEIDIMKSEITTLTDTLGELATTIERNNLTSIPIAGEIWDSAKNYITGDTVIYEGIGYVAIHYSKNKTPSKYLSSHWKLTTTETTYYSWDDIEDGTVIEVDKIVSYSDALWICIEQHIKSTVYIPKTGSSKWTEYTA